MPRSMNTGIHENSLKPQPRVCEATEPWSSFREEKFNLLVGTNAAPHQIEKMGLTGVPPWPMIHANSFYPQKNQCRHHLSSLCQGLRKSMNLCQDEAGPSESRERLLAVCLLASNTLFSNRALAVSTTFHMSMMQLALP